uniref:FHA domain-containing protein n=1 Tax=Desertihabitans aurantiacus TaxID=2282477 RepID=UPI0013005C42
PTAELPAASALAPRRGARALDPEAAAHRRDEAARRGRAPDEGWVLALDDGREVRVKGLVLIGRNPRPRPGEEAAELVTVDQADRTVSKTHLAVGVDARGLYVVDRGSTNGSSVAAPYGDYESCPPGEPVRVGEGHSVSFGENSLEVRRTKH